MIRTIINFAIVLIFGGVVPLFLFKNFITRRPPNKYPYWLENLCFVMGILLIFVVALPIEKLVFGHVAIGRVMSDHNYQGGTGTLIAIVLNIFVVGIGCRFIFKKRKL